MSFHKRTLAFGLGVFLAFAALAGAQTWIPLAHQPTFSASTALLLTDGTVMVQAIESNVWWRLTPDSTGSYINGTWSQLANMPTGYNPLYFASAVLPDGRVVVEGGEYNGGPAVDTNLGAIYNPATNTWTSVTPPSGVTQIGDASGTVLANGTFMLGPCCFQTTDYLLNASTLTWTATGSAGKADVNAEETWTLLPNGNILTVDTENGTNSEIYNPSTGAWTSAGSTIVQLPFSPGGFVPEIGPAVLRPNGTVFATGATSNTAIYNAATGTWLAGPTFPNGLDIADGPAALLPNGNVLADTSPGVFASRGAHFFEFNGTSLTEVSAPPRAAVEYSYEGRMLVLPTGQILFTDGSTDVEIYTANGTYQNSWRPTIASFPSTVNPGVSSYSISGTQFNGLSEGSSYGDDAQSATNYPLVRITNNTTGHVFYAKTHNHSRMGVASGSASVSTLFDVPAGIETGASQLEVVANGIPSFPVAVDVQVPVNYAGNLDHAGCDTIAGWAADANRLNTSIAVSFYNNGSLFSTVLASNSRPDVGAYLGDNGLHGFSIATPNLLKDGVAHTLSVRFESSATNLSLSPATLTCSPPPPPPVADFSFSCTALTCTFNGGSSTGTGLTYSWSFGATGSVAVKTFPSIGVYTVTLTVTDSLSRTSTKTKKVSVTSDPVPAAESYFTVPPCRVLDTRNTTILSNGTARVVNIAGLCGIPSTAKAVSFNVTAISPTGSGKLRLYPGNVGTPQSSSINFDPATSPRANSAVIQLATNGAGTLAIYPEVSGSPGQVHAVLDVQGYFSTDTTAASGATGPLGYQTVPICRAADTRSGSPLTSGTARTFTAQGVCGIPSGAAAASLHVGAPSPGNNGSIALYPGNLSAPGVSNISFLSTTSNLRNGALVGLSSTTPDFAALYSGTTGTSVHAYFDVTGYFKSGAPLKYYPITPCRTFDTSDAAMGGPVLTTGTVRTFQVQGNCGVPVGAKAALVRLVVSAPTSAGDLTVYPSNLPLPAVSTVKFDAGEAGLSMNTVVPLSTLSDDLAVSPGQMTAGGTVGLAVDVFGYFQ